MICEHLKLPAGVVAIACSRGRRRPRCSVKGCLRPYIRLCDFPLLHGATCDRRLCSVHAKPQRRPNVDYCPEHAYG